MHGKIVFIAAAAALIAQSDATAVIFCANSPASLQSSLSTAATNGFHDEIRIVSGVYQAAPGSCGAQACFEVAAKDQQMLRISGGWNAGCTSQTGKPTDTVLSGLGSHRALYVSLNSSGAHESWVRNLSVWNGMGPAFGEGGCAFIENSGGPIRVENLHAAGCISPGGRGGGLHVQARGLRFANNVVVENLARWGAVSLAVSSFDDMVVLNNTIANNLSQSGSAGVGGLYLAGLSGLVASAYVSNNIVADNDAGDQRWDIGSNNISVMFRNNLYGTLFNNGHPSPGSSGNIIANPEFHESGYTLRPWSPARNAGLNLPFGGLPEADFLHTTRIKHGVVDMGAYEHDDPASPPPVADEIFSNSFELIEG